VLREKIAHRLTRRDPPTFERSDEGSRSWERKTLDLATRSDKIGAKRQATWGMSVHSTAFFNLICQMHGAAAFDEAFRSDHAVSQVGLPEKEEFSVKSCKTAKTGPT